MSNRTRELSIYCVLEFYKKFVKLCIHFIYMLAKRGGERKRKGGEMRRMSYLFKES